MVQNLNELVWTLNPDQDNLQKLTTRLEEYATNMGMLKNMKVKISVPHRLDDANLQVEARRNIYLFCKEAINNAVKYSHATSLELTIKQVNDRFEFSVSDNGRGFDEHMIKRGNGLDNMQKRAEEMGAIFSIQSNRGGGSLVSLELKIT